MRLTGFMRGLHSGRGRGPAAARPAAARWRWRACGARGAAGCVRRCGSSRARPPPGPASSPSQPTEGKQLAVRPGQAAECRRDPGQFRGVFRRLVGRSELRAKPVSQLRPAALAPVLVGQNAPGHAVQPGPRPSPGGTSSSRRQAVRNVSASTSAASSGSRCGAGRSRGPGRGRPRTSLRIAAVAHPGRHGADNSRSLPSDTGYMSG